MNCLVFPTPLIPLGCGLVLKSNHENKQREEHQSVVKRSTCSHLVRRFLAGSCTAWWAASGAGRWHWSLPGYRQTCPVPSCKWWEVDVWPGLRHPWAYWTKWSRPYSLASPLTTSQSTRVFHLIHNLGTSFRALHDKILSHKWFQWVCLTV